MWQSVGLALLVIVATLVCVLIFMLCGWYVVWQLFLSKFKFLRELLGDAAAPRAQSPPPPTESANKGAGDAPARNRPRTTRQRVAFPESSL
ncbi:small integral membrane protein 13 [Corythoichthys intestinalis]|uniref:small integral membrane protein 13 n=1 Tax=Corythoichthys intestinalis TaxID=161448 RepID=UPI0025A4EA3E|nr:small integral membrane protein 13 [Corythoichthys intestinalis]XP_061808250.1 small integral membrane protein 13-like [Nerophis lumbriciformis]